jgi:hypothetical protein
MEIILSTKKFGELTYKIDEDKYKELVLGHKIYVSLMSNNKYYLLREDRKYIHRLVMGFIPKNLVVDHINGDTLDNRIENLRLVTYKENRQNTDKNRFTQDDIFKILVSPLSNNNLASIFNCSNSLISNIRTGKIYDNYFPEILRCENKNRRQKVYRS